MTAYAERIRHLREQTGKSADEMAASLGMGEMAYFDLESHDDELLDVPSLADVKSLTAALGVTTAQLLSEDGRAAPTRRITHAELVERVKVHLREAGASREAFEDQIGWSLDAFFESEERTLSAYNADFLKILCESVGVPWLDALP